MRAAIGVKSVDGKEERKSIAEQPISEDIFRLECPRSDIGSTCS